MKELIAEKERAEKLVREGLVEQERLAEIRKSCKPPQLLAQLLKWASIVAEVFVRFEHFLRANNQAWRAALAKIAEQEKELAQLRASSSLTMSPMPLQK